MSNAHHDQPRHLAGSPTGGQFASKERADADGAPLGTPTAGTADLGSMYFHAGNPPRTPIEQEIVRADKAAARAKDRADRLHETAILQRIQAAYPDVAALQLDVGDGEEAGMLAVRALDASGQDVDEDLGSSFGIAGEIDSFLASEYDHTARWREEAEFSAANIVGPQSVIDIATELENAPIVPEPGSIDASVARAEDIVGDYLAVHDSGADEQTAARDLLTDMYHLARQKGWDFDNLVHRAASMGYEEENEPIE